MEFTEHTSASIKRCWTFEPSMDRLIPTYDGDLPCTGLVITKRADRYLSIEGEAVALRKDGGIGKSRRTTRYLGTRTDRPAWVNALVDAVPEPRCVLEEPQVGGDPS